jgi:hypothetical protein
MTRLPWNPEIEAVGYFPHGFRRLGDMLWRADLAACDYTGNAGPGRWN